MKKLLWGIGLLLILSLGWYFFLKPYDYLAKLTVKTFPGAINQTIKAWGNNHSYAQPLEQQDLQHLTQYLKFGDSIFTFQWDIEPVNDSVSTINVKVSDKAHSLNNRLTIPFGNTAFEQRTRKTLLDFNAMLKEHIGQFSVKVVGEEEVRGTYVAYTTFTTKQGQKARGMMRDYPLLSYEMDGNKVPLNGTPFLQVTDWNMEKDSVTCNFYFPIVQSAKLPQNPEIKYKRFYPKKALKAVYHGNYITSDRAWYALLDYAKEHNIAVEPTPIEVYHNNPNMDNTNAMEWTADIYLPLKDETK